MPDVLLVALLQLRGQVLNVQLQLSPISLHLHVTHSAFEPGRCWQMTWLSHDKAEAEIGAVRVHEQPRWQQRSHLLQSFDRIALHATHTILPGRKDGQLRGVLARLQVTVEYC